jgi:tetratricopeptide (TPR) repeat protein
VFYHLQQEYGKQEQLSERAVRVQPTAAVFFNNLVHSRVHLGKLDDARAAIAIAQQNIPRNPDVAFMRTEVLEEEMKTDSADMVLDSVAKARPNDVPTVQPSLSSGSHPFASWTHRRRRQVPRRGAWHGRAPGQSAGGGERDSRQRRLRFWFRNQQERALRTVDARPRTRDGNDVARPASYPRFVDLYSRLGRVDKARPYLEQMATLPRFQNPDGQRTVAASRAAIARAEKRFDDAIRDYRAAIGGGCPACGLPDLAMTYDQASQPDSAIAIYTRYTEGRAISVNEWATWLAMTHRRLGELYDGKGNVDSALSHYAQFVELWKSADPELQRRCRKCATACASCSVDAAEMAGKVALTA